MVGFAGDSDSSSGEEDGDAKWKAAIDSVAAVGFSSFSNGLTISHASSVGGSLVGDGPANRACEKREKKTKDPRLKLYQIKAQKLLDDLLDRNLKMVSVHIPVNNYHQSNEGVIRLFRKAPPGMRLDPVDPHPGSQKKPKIIPGEEIHEKSKKFRQQMRSVAVGGCDIEAAARSACQRAQAKWEARDAAAKAAAKQQEESVSELKRITL